MQDQTFSFAEFVGFIRRRMQMMSAIALLAALIGVSIVYAVPAKYRSTATILIEEQEIPRELVQSTVTSYADERIQVIGQRVMTRSTLLPIVEKFDLYARERERVSTEEVLEQMRRDIRVEPVSANITDRRSGARTAATIAFRLSYDSTEPAKAQQVANELLSLYLNENLRSRQERAGETQTFLADEAERIGRDIAVTEAKLAAFKRENAGRLPELLSVNTQLRDRAENELEELQRRVQMIEDRKIYLESQLAVMRENAPSVVPPVSEGAAANDPKTRLRQLRNQYTVQSSVYGKDHPDLVRMRKEIAALEQSVGEVSPDFDPKKLEDARKEFSTLSDRYGPDHPDVLRQKKIVMALEASRDQAQPAATATTDVTTSPAYMSVVTQIELGKQEAAGIKARTAEVRGRLAALNSRIQETPSVELAYRELVRDHENAVAKYQELRAKQMQAQVAVEMEKDSKGERFSLIEPPQYPEKPTEPNRKKMLAMAMFGSVGSGVGAGYLAEMLYRSVTSPRVLSGLLEAPLLGVVPRVENEQQRVRRRRLITIALVALAFLAVVALLAVHVLYMPLDTLWYVAMRRLGI
jgi:uncharacterized protein involved in exopolysaccharide biosynthesis